VKNSCEARTKGTKDQKTIEHSGKVTWSTDAGVRRPFPPRRTPDFAAFAVYDTEVRSSSSSSSSSRGRIYKKRILVSAQRSAALQSVYAARKRLRTDTAEHPGEWQVGMETKPVFHDDEQVGMVGVHRLPASSEHMLGVMQRWTPAEWLANVRMSQNCFLYILRRIELRLVSRRSCSGGKRPTPSWCQLAATFAWLGGGRAVDLQNLYCMSRSTFHKIRVRVTRILVEELEHLIRFPTEEVCLENSIGFSGWCKFGGVVGAVDGACRTDDVVAFFSGESNALRPKSMLRIQPASRSQPQV
jgi:hypothetical protein